MKFWPFFVDRHFGKTLTIAGESIKYVRVNRLDEGHFWLSLAVQKGFSKQAMDTKIVSHLFNMGAFDRKEILSVNKDEEIIGLWELQGNMKPGNGADYNDLKIIESLIEKELNLREKNIHPY